MLRSPLLVPMVVLLLAHGSRTPDPHITALEAVAGTRAVSVRFQLENALVRDEVLQGLRSGLPTGFTYEIELVRSRPNWFDETVARSEIEVIATFNSVTQEYLLNYRRDRRLVRSENVANLAALQQKMTQIREDDLLPIDGFRPRKLIVRARADILRGYLFYVVPWDLSTDWKEVRVQVPK
jgi:hypothetical protein